MNLESIQVLTPPLVGGSTYREEKEENHRSWEEKKKNGEKLM